MKKSQQGFGAPEGIFVILTILLVGIIGIYTWHHSQTKVRPATKTLRVATPTSPLAKIASETPSQLEMGTHGWGTSNNFLQNNLSFLLPIVGWRMTSEGWNGYSSLTWIAEDPGYGTSTDGAQFAIQIYVAKDAGAAKSWNGVISASAGSTIGTLKNGIKIWQSNKATYDRTSLMECSGGHYNHVVQLSAQSEQGLYVPLPNGRYMTYLARFCLPNYGHDLNMSYAQQANSPEMLIAARLLESIEFQPQWTPPNTSQ